jgi:hypothetical protein
MSLDMVEMRPLEENDFCLTPRFNDLDTDQINTMNVSGGIGDIMSNVSA